MLSFVNGTPVSLEAIPTLASDAFKSIFTAEDFERDRKRVLALWKLPDGRLACVLGNPATHKLEVCATPAATYQPLRDEVPALHRFEAELRGEDRALLETYGQDISFLDRTAIVPLVKDIRQGTVCA